MTPHPTTNAPTEKQVAFLRKLLAERAGIDAAEAVRGCLNIAREQGVLDRRYVSSAIESLLAIPAAKAAPRQAEDGRNIYEQAQPGDLAYVPEGHYATPSRTGSQDLDFWRVDRPAEGRWAGRVFVKRVIGGRADQAVRGTEAIEALRAIIADPEAGPRYGQTIGQCYRCNRTLTDETSRSLGIGPTCRES